MVRAIGCRRWNVKTSNSNGSEVFKLFVEIQYVLAGRQFPGIDKRHYICGRCEEIDFSFEENEDQLCRLCLF